MENFHTQYDKLYMKNMTDDENSDAEDENLILRSFTDDPEIPLRQIKVLQSYLATCSLQVHVYVHIIYTFSVYTCIH